ncbi:hypothetical protein N5P37_005698, partial [Trichoderma harzianum]
TKVKVNTSDKSKEQSKKELKELRGNKAFYSKQEKAQSSKSLILEVLIFSLTYNTCLGCNTLTDGATYCSESCQLFEDNNKVKRVHNSSLSSPRLTEASSTTSPRRRISAKTKKELRTYNISLDQ